METVRGPLSNFLRSHLDLIKTFTKSLEIEAGLDNPELIDSVVAFAFERYYRTASLIGTPQSCVPMVERLKAIGVNEVACLIDFGVDTETTLESLAHLDALRQLCQPAAGGNAEIQTELAAFLQKQLPSVSVPKLVVVENPPQRTETLQSTSA